MATRNDAGTRFSKPLLCANRTLTKGPFSNGPVSLLDFGLNSVYQNDFVKQSDCQTVAGAIGTPWRSDVIGSGSGNTALNAGASFLNGIYSFSAGTTNSTGIQVMLDNATSTIVGAGSAFSYTLNKYQAAEFRVQTANFGLGTTFWGVGVRDTSAFSTAAAITITGGCMMFSMDDVGVLKFRTSKTSGTDFSTTTLKTYTTDPTDYFTCGFRSLPVTGTNTGLIEIFFNGAYVTTLKDVMPASSSTGMVIYFGAVNAAAGGGGSIAYVDYVQTLSER
jgi:hypothetical protein